MMIEPGVGVFPVERKRHTTDLVGGPAVQYPRPRVEPAASLRLLQRQPKRIRVGMLGQGLSVGRWVHHVRAIPKPDQMLLVIEPVKAEVGL